MAEINAAWRTLSDPGRRAMYDASLRPASATTFSAAAPTDRLQRERYPVAARASGDGPQRFPYGAMVAVVLVAMVVAFIASGVAARGNDSTRTTLNPIMRPGDCVVFEPNTDARKVPCDDLHDGVVADFVPFDTSCAIGTEPHRDRQGMGIACVARPAG